MNFFQTVKKHVAKQIDNNNKKKNKKTANVLNI